MAFIAFESAAGSALLNRLSIERTLPTADASCSRKGARAFSLSLSLISEDTIASIFAPISLARAFEDARAAVAPLKDAGAYSLRNADAEA